MVIGDQHARNHQPIVPAAAPGEILELQGTSGISLTMARSAAHTHAALISGALDAARRQGEEPMRHTKDSSEPRHRGIGRRLLRLTAAALASLSTVAATSAASESHRLKLDTTMFAAQVGSTPTGANVYAGTLFDPKLGHGAIVFSTKGKTTLRVMFREFFTRGSISGSGTVTLSPGTGGRAKLSGSFKIDRGTGRYEHARGKLSAAGTSNKAGMVHATFSGSVTY